MIVGEVRSGLVETRHPVTVAAVDETGRVIASIGADPDRPFFFRSASKPFQGFVSQRNGAALGTEQLAIGCASHGGQPVHLAYVEEMLAGVGLDAGALKCPPSWPRSASAMRRAATAGLTPRPLLHNCSGKHAAMLHASAASGWPIETYTEPDHPLQREIAEYLAEVTGVTGGSMTPTGVDGCGVPVCRGTVPGLARAYARLANDRDLGEVADAMYRFASLTSDGTLPEAGLARWVPGPVKGGARGCLGMAWHGGVGIAAKSWSGEMGPAVIGVIEMLRRLGLLPSHPEAMLHDLARPPVLGGGRPVGTWMPIEDQGR